MSEITVNSEGKFICPECKNPYATRSYVTKHMKAKHQVTEPVKADNPPIEEQNKDDNPQIEEQNKADKSTVEMTAPKLVENPLFLDTNDVENLLENEEEFRRNVESLEYALGLDVNLSVNESMIEFIQDESNHNSDFGREPVKSDFAKTLELEEETKSKKKMEIELKVAKKTISDLRRIFKMKENELTECQIMLKKSEEENINKGEQLKGNGAELTEANEMVNTVIEESNEQIKSLEDEVKGLRRYITLKFQQAPKEQNPTKKPTSVDLTNEEVRYKCDECPSTFKKIKLLKGHMMFFHGPHCKVCGIKFQTEIALASHMQSIHESNENTLSCDICGQEKASESEMTKHYNNMHVRESRKETIMQFKCGKCQFVSNNKTVVDNHMQRKHTIIIKDTMIECENCDFKTNRNDTMDSHINSEHDQEMKVVMPPCRYYEQGRCTKGSKCKFSHEGRSKLKTHMKNDHVPRCNRGEGCTFKKQGRCYYFHSGVGVQKKREDASPHRVQTQPEEGLIKSALYCKYQESCKKKDSCIFKHFSKGFAKKVQTKIQ